MRRLLALLVLMLPLASAALAAERVFDLTIAHGRLPGRQDTIRVQQGDNVVLRWHSDRPIVLHLHGYEIVMRVTPGVAAEMRFEARATGRFPIHVCPSSEFLRQRAKRDKAGSGASGRFYHAACSRCCRRRLAMVCRLILLRSARMVGPRPQ